MTALSVIVPVYQAAEYLDCCVESILAQTFSDLELILVDDGSTDGSAARCDRWAAADSRVRVIHRENGGVSAARNMGLDAARGEYVAFVDSDDWVEPQMYENLLAAAREYDCAVVLCDCRKVLLCKSRKQASARQKFVRKRSCGVVKGKHIVD